MLLLNKFITYNANIYSKIYVSHSNISFSIFLWRGDFICYKRIASNKHCHKRNNNIIIECSAHRNKKYFNICVTRENDELYIECDVHSTGFPHIKVSYSDDLNGYECDLKFIINFSKKDKLHKSIHKQNINNYSYLREFIFGKIDE